MKVHRILSLTLLVLGMARASLAAEAFFHDGRTNWKIYLSPHAEPPELLAAEELRDALLKISNTRFEIVVAEVPPESRAIIIGDLKNPEVQARAAALKFRGGENLGRAPLGQTPHANETWQARFVRHHGVRQESATAVFPEHDTTLLLFSSAARTDRSLLWWSGAPDREGPRNAALVQEFTEAGWQIHLVADEEKLRASDERYDVYWFRHPHGPNKVPADYWQKHLASAVRDGALAVFVSYWGIPLDEYLQDSSLKVTSVSCGKIPLAERTTAFVAPGDWSRKPNDLLRGLKSQITPAYGFVPTDADAWTVLATAANGSDPPYPYLLARRYGKGLIVLGGDDIRLAPANMLENLVRYREHVEEPFLEGPPEE